MKSKTSFFSAAVLKKDITRFAPLWAVYTVLFAIVFVINGYDEPAKYAYNLADLCSAMPVVTCFYAIAVATMVFGDLYRTQTAYTLLAMPLRREGHYITHTVSGLLMGIVPHILMMPILLYMTRGEGSMMPFIWLLVTVLCYLLFFGISALSCQLAGSRLGAALIYLAVNFFWGLLYSFINILYIPVLGGVRIDENLFIPGSPVMRLPELDFVDCYYECEITRCEFHYYGLVKETWIYLIICVVIGLLVFGIGLWFCRRRKAETAGDLVAVRKISPVFLAVYTMVCGEFFYYIVVIFTGTDTVAFLVVGMIAGFLTGLMLLKRTIKVFTAKSFIAFGVTALVLYVSFLAVKLDPFGRIRYVPNPDEVESVSLTDYYNKYMNTENVITDKESIKKVTDAHRALIDVSAPQGNSFSVYYRLKNGTTIVRTYDCYDIIDWECNQKVKLAFSIPEVFFRTDDLDSLINNIKTIEIEKENYNLNSESAIIISSAWNDEPDKYTKKGNRIFYRDALEDLFDAALADSADGHLYHPYYGVDEFYYLNICEKNNDTFTLLIFSEATHTKALIDSLFNEAEK